MRLTVDSFSNLAVEPAFMRYGCSDEPSKIEKQLGGVQGWFYIPVLGIAAQSYIFFLDLEISPICLFH